MVHTVDELLKALPTEVTGFAGSDYPLPLCQAVLGDVPDPDRVRVLVGETDRDDAPHLAEHAALAAECYESSLPDAQDLFVADGSLRGLVFSGSKWRAGWAFLLGDESDSLGTALEERGFIVFSGDGRPTRPVYWLQMMVRYAMIWGRIPPGDDHEMGHFLEADLPGVLIVRGATCELEALLALAMMKLGRPAIVPEDFPFEEGRQARLGDADEILDALATLPNLRELEVAGERVALPDYCDPAYAREPFEAARAIGGDEHSFFVVKPGRAAAGAEVVGDPADSVGVLITVGDERLDVALSDYVERTALELPGYLPDLRVVEREPFALGIKVGGSLDATRLADVLQAGLRWQFPRLRDVNVKVVLDASELARLAPEVSAFRRERAGVMDAQTEDGVGDVVACIECQSFSHSHVCVVTPDRPPMCGRDPGQVKAAALFGATWHPYRRRGLAVPELREVVPKGRCLDADRGEYEGINEAAGRMTGGVITRVLLHSLDECPHSSCGCFHLLAFRIAGAGPDGADGIGVMQRGFDGSAPNGETWNSLANRAGGKQADGVTGLSAGYLRSPRFLRADGGLGAVVWATANALEQFRDLLPDGREPATENEARTMEELAQFLSSRA